MKHRIYLILIFFILVISFLINVYLYEKNKKLETELKDKTDSLIVHEYIDSNTDECNKEVYYILFQALYKSRVKFDDICFYLDSKGSTSINCISLTITRNELSKILLDNYKLSFDKDSILKGVYFVKNDYDSLIVGK